MSKKSSLYTKTGDKGQTSLVSGARISKASSRLELYGEVDDLNAHLGFANALLAETKVTHQDKIFLLNQKIQSALFDLGSKLACETYAWEKYKLPDIKTSLVEAIEQEIDFLDSHVEPLKNFILPGGHKVAASFHIVRTQTRNVERLLVAFIERSEEPKNALCLLNRLSDYFFIVSRYINKELNETEIQWNA